MRMPEANADNTLPRVPGNKWVINGLTPLVSPTVPTWKGLKHTVEFLK